MTIGELRKQFEKIAEDVAVFPRNEPNLDYVKWLESLVLASEQREREAFEAGREDAEYSIYKEMIYFKYDTFKDYEKEKQSIKT